MLLTKMNADRYTYIHADAFPAVVARIVKADPAVAVAVLHYAVRDERTNRYRIDLDRATEYYAETSNYVPKHPFDSAARYFLRTLTQVY